MLTCHAANFWWGMVWEDDRTADLIAGNGLNDPTYICQAWCSTEQGLDVLSQELGIDGNGTGQASCCDGEHSAEPKQRSRPFLHAE